MTSNIPISLSNLDEKILKHFPGLVVRKELTKELKQNAVVPTYVLEYLLGQHCSSEDPEQVKQGLESVRRILAKHYVNRNQSELIKSTIQDKGSHKVIDKVTVSFNEKEGFHEAQFTNLGIKKVPIDDSYVKRFEKLLVGGIWSITNLAYETPIEPKASPWRIETLKPIQIPSFNYDEYLESRKAFTTEEWLEVLMQSVGFNPKHFSRRAKILTLIRLVPFCERNYNLLELGPKGTGKSHIYAEFSPHGMLISGSEVTSAKLFVTNSNGKIGLVGYWDCICFDEFAGKDKKIDKTLVDIMKNYMANKSFSRGIEQLTASASMVFMGNTKKSVAYMLKNSNFFDALPDKYIDSAFLDRIHAFNPGWEVQPIHQDLFTSNYGFIVDFLAEALKHLRNLDYTSQYKKYFEITSEVSTRDQTGFEKTFSGLMKIIFPNEDATKEEIREILEFSMESRRRVREQILRIDNTFKPNEFEYKSIDESQTLNVKTPEEIQYPEFYNLRPEWSEKKISKVSESHDKKINDDKKNIKLVELKESHIIIPENSKGWSYKRIFADYLKGSQEITIKDPYIRAFYQIKNLVDFLCLANQICPEGDEIKVHLITSSDFDSDEKQERQIENLNKIKESFFNTSTPFSYEINFNPNFHARSITTDNGWKISIDRGLDIFQWFEQSALNAESNLQEARLTRGCEINFNKINKSI